MYSSINKLSFNFLCLVTVSVLLVSCDYFKKQDDSNKEIIAKAFNYKLYREDVLPLIYKGISKDDSMIIVRNFIDSWIKQKVVLHTAEIYLDDEKKDVTKKLEEYRNSLITYAYENELIRQKLDTFVSEEQVVEFYKNNPQNFELKDNIIKVIYLKLNKNSPKLDKVKQWYTSSGEKERQALTEYCRQYAINYYLNDDTWLLFDDLLKEIPIKTYDKEQFLQNNRNIVIEDSMFVYLINIKGFMVKNSLSPLSFERKNIVSMIINERKLKLIEDLENEILQDAKRNGDITVY